VFQFTDEIYKINSGNLASESKFKALLAERFFQQEHSTKISAPSRLPKQPKFSDRP
jgi:hypothetical protein